MTSHKLRYRYFLLGILWMFVLNIATAQIPTAGLVGYWPFNGNANDMSGNGNHGILECESNNPQLTTDRFGNANSAYEFGGYYNKNWIRVPNNSTMLLTDQMTISLWFQQCEFAGMDGWGSYSTTDAGFSVLTKAGDGIAAYPGIFIGSGINSQTGKLSVNSANTNGHPSYYMNYEIRTEYNCFDTCEWVHFVSIIDDTIAKIYLNGVLYIDTIINHADYTQANIHDLFIGRMGCNGFIWYPFNGKIDDVAFYNRALSDDEVAQLFGQFYDEHAFENIITIDSLMVTKACNGNDGQVQIFPDTLNAPYLYALDFANNFQSSNIIQNISSGVHRIYIKSTCGLKDTLIDFTCPQPTLPDNVDSADCTMLSTGHNWGIDLDWSSAEMVSPLVIPLVGDINGDQVPEIICFAPDDSYNFYGSNQVLVFNSLTHQVMHTFTTSGPISTVDAAPYGIIKLPNGHVIMVIALQNYTMCAYDLTALETTPLWNVTTDYYAPNVSFVDFNSDSYPEVYIGNKIYDVETGALLISDPNITNTASSLAHNGNTPLPSPCAADVVGDSKPDLILGNEIYEVIITNRNGLAGNSITLSKSITPPAGVAIDGHPQVADFNLDGYLDVLVSKKSSQYGDVGCYVWDVHNNTVSNPLIIPTNDGGKSIPLIADVDNDDTLEVVIQCNASSGNKVKCYKYNIATNSFSFLWDIYVDEDSYSNSMTVFDFNNDGNNDLLISDQTTVRIVNGSGHSHLTGNDTIPVYVLTSLTFGECTVMQYPVVADVNADGSAELVVLGRFGSGHTYQAFLNVFKSAGVPWAPARPVWNQYMYNVTNVNKDLTVPQYLFNNATPFTDPQGVVRRPFNNFLQQATTIDQYGRPFYAVPDVAIDNADVQIVGGNLVLTLNYCNLGDNTLNAPYPITVFVNTYGGDTLCTTIINDNLPVDSCTQCEIYLSPNVLCGIPGLNAFAMAVNCAGEGIAQNGGLQYECDTTNNTAVVSVEFLTDSVLIVEQACDSYVWNGTTYTISGAYTFTVSNTYGCDSIVTLQLTINHSVEIEDSLTLCENQLPYTYGDTVFGPSTPSSATFVLHRLTSAGCDSIVTVHLTINPTGLTEYYDSVCQHSPYSGYGFSLSGTQTANSGLNTFERTLSNQYGCDSVIRLNLWVKPLITPDFYADPDRALLSENPVIHFVNNTDIVEIVQSPHYWVWDFGDGTSDTTWEAETSHLYTQWGDYTVTLTLWADGCAESSSVPLFVEADLEFPNVITPNGDGINDVFIITNLNPNRQNRLYITDRWGKAVWNQDNYQTYSKDGQVYNADSGFGMGNNLSAGVYYYTFYYEGAVRTLRFNGSITVIK